MIEPNAFEHLLLEAMCPADGCSSAVQQMRRKLGELSRWLVNPSRLPPGDGRPLSMQRLTKAAHDGRMVPAAQLYQYLGSDCLGNHIPPAAAIRGCEVLPRIFDPQHGVVSPNGFIEKAIHENFMIKIDEEMISRACAIAFVIARAGCPSALTTVNASQVSLEHPAFVPNVQLALEKERLPGEHIGLELLETIGKVSKATLKKLHILVEMGIRLLSDDYGRGNSEEIARTLVADGLPIHGVKIEGNMVCDLLKGREGPVRHCITEARRLGASILIFEGVPSGLPASAIDAARDLLLKTGTFATVLCEGRTIPDALLRQDLTHAPASRPSRRARLSGARPMLRS